jgi:site-specific recombinase XerD
MTPMQRLVRERFRELVQLAPILEQIPDDLAGFRDRPLLVLMYSGRLSGAALSELTIDRLSFRSDALQIYPGANMKFTAQVLRTEHPLTDPVQLVREWLARASLTQGPLFRPVHGTTIGERALTRMGIWMTVKRRFEAAGMEPLEIVGSPFMSTFVLRQLKAGARDAEVAQYVAQGERLTRRWASARRGLRP